MKGHVAACWTVTGLVALAPGAGAAQQEMGDVEIRTEQLADGVYVLFGRGGNIGVSVGDDGVFLIDDQYAPLTDRILAALAEITDEQVGYVINTHWHGDHTGGNENLGDRGALLIAHDEVRRRLSTEWVRERPGAAPQTVSPRPEGAWPVITFSEDVTFYLNGGEMHAFHVPHAHTDGDAIIHFRDANVVHMGDTYFEGRYPFIDVSSGGAIDGVIAAAERVLEISDGNTRIVPGHGPVSSRADLQAYRDMLVGIRDRVAEAIAQGLTLEETVASGVTDEYEDAEGIVTAAYVSLSRK